MFRSNVSVLRNAACLSILWASLLGSGCSPCHTGHTEVEYYEAYDSWEENCWGSEESEICIPYIEHHPARCGDWWRCDLNCDALDKGRTEAHPKHQTLNLYGDKVDPRCNWQGGKSWPK